MFSIDAQQLKNENYIFSITQSCRRQFEDRTFLSRAASILYLILLLPYFICRKGSIPPMAPNMLIPMPLMPLTNPLPTPWGNVRLTNSFLWQCSESNDSRSRFLETLEAKLVTLVKVPALTCLTKLDEPVVIPKMVRTQKSLNQGCFPITNQFVYDQ